jgi:N4-gp56 family major capsid protein
MLNYNAPNGTPSDIDNGADQMNTFFYLKKALISARKDQYFSQLASVTNMPKHFGKTIKVHEYVPLLDDRNVNDQGLDASGVVMVDGNLYGSSKDVGTITSRLPVLGENGGRVNRVGFTRLTREGSLHKFGFFTEFTQEALDFDSDAMLMDHLSRELLSGAVQVTEAVLQKDLLTSAGVNLYSGAAVSRATVTGEVVPAVPGVSPEIPASIINYSNLMRLDQILTDNRTPKHTTVITGSRLIDTKTLPAARIMYIGSELLPMLRGMTDLFGNKAFIEVQHYADAANTLQGEVGSIDSFRIIVVPEMQHWDGAGAVVTDNEGYRTSTVGGAERYNVYPMMVIGDDSFTTIGFQSDGKSGKFTIKTKMPNKDITHEDPFAETGLSSIKWYYGILIKRPERLAVAYTVAPL